MDAHNIRLTGTLHECHTPQQTDQPTTATAHQHSSRLALFHDVTLNTPVGPSPYPEYSGAQNWRL